MAAGNARRRTSATRSNTGDTVRGPRARAQKRCGRKVCMSEKQAKREADRLRAAAPAINAYFCVACCCWHVGKGAA